MLGSQAIALYICRMNEWCMKISIPLRWSFKCIKLLLQRRHMVTKNIKVLFKFGLPHFSYLQS